MENSRERRSQRLFWALIIALLLGYAALKYRHVSLAFDAYEGQVLMVDKTGAVK